MRLAGYCAQTSAIRRLMSLAPNGLVSTATLAGLRAIDWRRHSR